jgi:hypothetical protein
MFIVRGVSEIGTASFACGTTEQALERVLDLLGRLFQNISVTDSKGRTWTADEFQRVFDEGAGA